MRARCSVCRRRAFRCWRQPPRTVPRCASTRCRTCLRARCRVWRWAVCSAWRMRMAKTILTVDDSRTMRDMLRLTLVNAGHCVIQADDGVAGIEALQSSGGVDAIITDINMPRMDGYGLIDTVRADPKY